MAVLNIRAHRMAALAVASLLSSTTIASAANKVVIVLCAPTGTGQAEVVLSCDKSTTVVASCPAAGTSCAQAVAVFESAPDSLQLINVSLVPSDVLAYTLGDQKHD